VPTNLQVTTLSEARCPAQELECEATMGEVVREDTIARGWGNGCFLFGEGRVCSKASIVWRQRNSKKVFTTFRISDPNGRNLPL
jgi:hypothetical protein